MTDLMARAGAQARAEGEHGGIRMNRQSGMYGADVSARFQEAVLRGNCYTVANQTGVASQAGLSATTPVLTLYNPASSGKNLVLWFAGASFDIAFAATGAVWLAAGTDTTDDPVTGTLSTITKNCLLGGSGGAALVYLAATLPTAPVAVSLLGMGLTGAITTIPQLQTLGRWFDGSIILKPNTNISLQTGVASGASGMFCEYVWEEIDV
jgi:hypothetical protein